MPVTRFLFVALGVLFSVASQAADWDSCADDLDRLRRAARDATDVAERVKTAAEEIRNCKRDSSSYRCSSVSSDFDSEVSSLNGELDTVARRVRDVRASCDMDIGGTVGFPPMRSSGNQMCDLMRRYVDRLPESTLIDTCKKSMPEAECRKCIAVQ